MLFANIKMFIAINKFVSDLFIAINKFYKMFLFIWEAYPDFGNDSPYLFTPMYEASFKGTKR